MRPIIAIDCETEPFKRGRPSYTPFVWGAYDGETYKEFWDNDQFYHWLKNQNCIAYAHNGGKFDFLFMVPYMESGTEPTIINGRIAKVKFGDAELRDSWCVIPSPLASYKKDEFDYTLLEPDVRWQHRDAISAYLRSDCVYLWQWVKEFFEPVPFALTLASSAMKIWHSMEVVEQKHTNASFYASIAPYYHGGRVEVFRRGEIHSPFVCVDINSAYPYAMIPTTIRMATRYEPTSICPPTMQTLN